MQDPAERFTTHPLAPTGFVCESANADCTEVVDLPLAVYEQVRRNPRRLIVLPGRVLPEVGPTSRRPNGVGQRSLSVTADAYTHVLLDDRELDHSRLVNRLGIADG